jgi:hypothetical protein
MKSHFEEHKQDKALFSAALAASLLRSETARRPGRQAFVHPFPIHEVIVRLHLAAVTRFRAIGFFSKISRGAYHLQPNNLDRPVGIHSAVGSQPLRMGSRLAPTPQTSCES